VDHKDRERVLVEVVQRVLDAYGHEAQHLEQVIFDTIFEERKRLETEPDRDRTLKQAHQYDRVHAEALHADPVRQRELLKGLIRAFADEIVGHFDSRVYGLATRAVPHGLNLLLNAMSPIKLARSLPNGLRDMDEHLDIIGHVDTVKDLAKRGTLVMVPTHLSNLDSILMGYAIYRMGLPPHVYGAGLNLFHNKLIGFFMHNLGAYKVDRRKKAYLYKDVLKTYAGCSMEIGYHNLFFPGGTRSRSGGVERRLKLGLLGMGLNAYVHNLIAKKTKPDIFFVPVTINYELVLEAETLIEDHLKEAGKGRYIIEDDEFSRPRVILDFTKKLFSMDSRIHIVVGHPLDVFGNCVDEHGRSLDHRDRPIDRTRYVLRDGVPVFDRQRDEELTRELAHEIVKSYHANTLPKSTHVLCTAVFQWLQERAPGMDLYRLLRTGGSEESMPMAEAYDRVERTLTALRRLSAEGGVLLDDELTRLDVPGVVSHALAHLSSYHRRPAAERRGDRLFHVDRNLLLYYRNRLAGHGLERGEVLQ
jgi:glycerol-3-phosphate O-acyltransferase